jgi:hypothetical protein
MSHPLAAPNATPTAKAASNKTTADASASGGKPRRGSAVADETLDASRIATSRKVFEWKLLAILASARSF